MNPRINIFLLSIITAVVVLFFLKDCSHSVVVNPSSGLMDSINILKAKLKVHRDSVIYRDSIRTNVVTKWKTIRHDSLIPCETKLLLCDTLILADSSLISAQKGLIFIQDSVIRMQDIVIKSDSIVIVKLNKEVKKQKQLKWLFLGLGLVPNMVR